MKIYLYLCSLITILLITGCDQNNPTNSSTTIFEKFPDWNYLYCESPTGAYNAFIKSGTFLVIEPEKNNPKIYAWQYLYELDLTYGGTSKNEEKTIKDYFSDKVVSHQAVVNYFTELRGLTQKDLIKKNK